MNKWYRSSLAKIILTVMAHILSVAIVVSALCISGYPGITEDILSGETAKKYEDSKGFAEQTEFNTHQIRYSIRYQKIFGKLEEVNKDSNVNIMQYYNEGKLLTKEMFVESEGSLMYQMEDLDKWSKNIAEYDQSGKGIIVVCEKLDGTYDYFSYEEFKQLITNKELRITLTGKGDMQGHSEQELMDSVEGGYLYRDSYEPGSFRIDDENGEEKYASIWTYDGVRLVEKVKPIGYESIVDFVGKNPEWNGKLSEVFGMVNDILVSWNDTMSSYENAVEQWGEGNTNLSYVYADVKEKQIYTNKGAFENYNKLDETLSDMKESGKYIIVRPKLSGCETNMNGIDMSSWKETEKNEDISDGDFIFAIHVDTTFPIEDTYYTQNEMYSKYAPNINAMLFLLVGSLLMLIIVIIWLTAVAGRRPDDEDIHINWFDRLKTEFAAGAMIFILMMLFYLGVAISQRSIVIQGTYDEYVRYYSTNRSYGIEAILMMSVVALSLCAVSIAAYLSLVRRLKARTLWKNSILRILVRLIVYIFENIGNVWKVLLLFLGFIFIHWVTIGSMGDGIWSMLMFAVEIAAAIYLIRRAVGQKKIVNGLEIIVGGEVNYQIPMDGLKGEQLVIAERINTIGEGLDAAVEASMKNERLKTDLITNVSHDIKTPLTSIINYVDLLKRENFEDPKIKGYLDILEAKAQRLKSLTEDVVEASKVSSGNITLEYMNINLVEMIQQTSGEFEEKFANRNLQEVLTATNEEAIIRADGRRVWRVLENIYNNASKYAMEGTRVYADLSVANDEVVFALKNVSEHPLNITADELTERFIRGDLSRSTEGSGLGLSIAKNLTEMQGGVFDIYVDGDLFKVTVRFARIKK